MKRLAYALVGTGLLLIAISVGADALGMGRDQGIGGIQFLGIFAGAVLVLLGLGSLTVKWGNGPFSRERIRLEKFIDISILHWMLGTFLVTYVSFFLVPVFFSGRQIHYLTKYIPDAFITHIGFDIQAIVSRIESWLATGQSPYADGFIAYPPLAIAVFLIFTLLGYPAYFKLMVGFTALAYLGAAWMLPRALVPRQNRTLLLLFFITGLFSYGLQFEQERGQFNLITFAFTLSAIYIFHFHPRFRFFAYALFTLSVQLKVYPLFFIVMLVDDWRDWRAIIKRFLGLGAVNLSLLFVLGYRLFFDFLRVITEYQMMESSRVENLSIKGYAFFLSNNLFGKADIGIATGVVEAIFWFLLGSCFFAVIGQSVLHKAGGLNPYLLLICTIAALVIPSISNDYKLSLLIPSMALLSCCLPEFPSPRRKTIMTMLVVIASLAYWTTLFPAMVKPDFLSRNFPALVVILISATALNFLAPCSYVAAIRTTYHPPEVEP